MVLSNSENVLHMIDEVYHVYEKIVLIMIWKSCQTIFIHLKSLVFFKPAPFKIKQMSSKFDSLHQIPYIIRTIDDYDTIPSLDPISNHCWKKIICVISRYSLGTLLVLGFWFWFGWKNVDWVIFLRKKIEKNCCEKKAITFVILKLYDLGFGALLKVRNINYHLERHIGILCSPT
jgi:hypothetical protein